MKKPVCPCCKKVIVGETFPIRIDSDRTENPKVSKQYLICPSCIKPGSMDDHKAFMAFIMRERKVLEGYAEEPIKTVFESNHVKFERVCRQLVSVGYTLSSSSCNSTEGGPLWCAVFIRKEAL